MTIQAFMESFLTDKSVRSNKYKLLDIENHYYLYNRKGPISGHHMRIRIVNTIQTEHWDYYELVEFP